MSENQPQPSDCAIRAITNDGAFRVITIRTTDMVKEAIRAQGVSGETARVFAELLTGSVLVRETMSPEQRVQLILKPRDVSLGKVAIVADSHPEGMTRGLIQRSEEDTGDLRLEDGMILQVIRVLYNKELQQGFVEAGAERSVSSALTDYMLTSEQITSVIEVAALLVDGEVVESAGFIVQMLPEITNVALAPMLEHLENRPALREILAERGARPAETMARLLQDFEHTILSNEPVSFGCQCSQAKIVQAMTTLGQDELRDIVESNSQIEIDCEYCKTHYVISASHLKPLLVSN